MSSFLTLLSEFMTSLLKMMGDVVDFITANPMILVAVVIAVAGIVVGIVKRFIPGL